MRRLRKQEPTRTLHERCRKRSREGQEIFRFLQELHRSSRHRSSTWRLYEWKMSLKTEPSFASAPKARRNDGVLISSSSLVEAHVDERWRLDLVQFLQEAEDLPDLLAIFCGTLMKGSRVGSCFRNRLMAGHRNL